MDMTERELGIVIQSQILGKPLVLIFQVMIVLIKRAVKSCLSSVDTSRGLGNLWRQVNDIAKGPPSQGSEGPLTADDLNDHYGRISTDSASTPPSLQQLLTNL